LPYYAMAFDVPR